jgi:hypothetical protein
MNKVITIVLVVLAVEFVSLQKVYAQVPRTISYQGVLTDAAGNLVADGNHQLKMQLYTVSSGGASIYSETQTVPVVKGLFNAIIGSVTALPGSLAFDRAYFLGVTVDNGTELGPRSALTAVPYALRAERANVAESLSPNATGVVSSLNNQTGALTLQGSGGTTITNNGNAFTISSTGSGGTGIQGVQNTDGTIAIQNPNGPVASIGIADGSISASKIADNSISASKLADGAVTNGKIATGQVVTSLNNLKNDVTLNAGSNVTITPLGNSITIAASGGGGSGIQQLQNTDNALSIANPNGPATTVNVTDRGITTSLLADGSVTNVKIAPGQTVKSVNTLKDDITLAAGSNVTITPSGNTLTIASTGGGGSNPWTVTGNDISNTNTGNVGVGVTNPTTKLHINGAEEGVRIQGPGTGAANLAYLSFHDAAGSRIGFVGDGGSGDRDISLSATTGNVTLYTPAGNVLTAASSGNVGIGTSTPAHRLSLIGGPTWTSNGWTGSLEMGNGSAIGWRANVGGKRFGIGQSGGGLYFFNTTSDPGTSGSAANYLMSITDGGNVAIGTSSVGSEKLTVNGSGGNAVYGYSTGGLGVWGVSSTNGGVLGTGYVGVQGNTNGDVNSQGIRGDNGGSNSVGYAGLFNGRAWVVGNLAKGGGSFKIDHPLDPKNKYLYHSFVESPDMKNIYDGVVTTDASGEAVISLPNYFMALNRDFRYQLTVIGTFAQVMVAVPIANNSFTIRTDKPGVQVSWQVTGIRQDAYANANRIPVEEEKLGKERGYYIHPQAFGQPEEQSIEWARNPEAMRQSKAARENAEKRSGN